MDVQRFFLYNLNEHDVYFPSAKLFGGREHRVKFNLFSESEVAIECSPQDSVGKFTYICHIKTIEINAKKLKKAIHFDN